MDETRSTCRPVPTAPKEGVLIRLGFHDRQETSQLLDRPLYGLVLPGPCCAARPARRHHRRSSELQRWQACGFVVMPADV